MIRLRDEDSVMLELRTKKTNLHCRVTCSKSSREPVALLPDYATTAHRSLLLCRFWAGIDLAGTRTGNQEACLVPCPLGSRHVRPKAHQCSRNQRTCPMSPRVQPCSGTGVMSKRADLRWRRDMDNLLELHLQQRKILWAASNSLDPGGTLVYSTCSLEYEENWMIIEAFLKKHPNFKLDNAINYVPKEYVDTKGALLTFPPKHGIDGGFAVRLIKDV